MTTLVTAVLTAMIGCGYPEVSPAAYDISKALYSVCNLKRSHELEPLTMQINLAHREGRLTDQESTWLLSIISQAANGNWIAATKESRAILEDQIGRRSRTRNH